MRRIAFLILTVLALLAAVAMATPVAVGGDVPAGTAVNVLDAPDVAVTETGWLILETVGEGFSIIDGVTSGSATIYLYTTAAGVVTKRYGPIYLRSWAGARPLVPAGARVHAIQIDAVTAETIITPRAGG